MTNIQKKKVSEMIIDDFKKKLANGELKEGDRLPNLSEYAKSLGVSRLSLREALQTMERIGAVTSRPKVGTTIICGDPSKWAYPLLPSIIEDENLISQLLEARMLFEGFISSQCAENINPEGVQKLSKILERQKEAYGNHDLDSFYNLDSQFHTFIAANCQNVFLHHMYTELLQTTNPPVTELFKKNPQSPKKSLMMHIKIFEAIRDKDVKAAEYFAREHLREVRESYKEKMGNVD
jgi:GntR family transcriptional repressor for pyruvate dehydrogenase complex